MSSRAKIVIIVIIIGAIVAISSWLWLTANQENQDENQSVNNTPLPTQLTLESSPTATQSVDDEPSDGIVKEIEVTNDGTTFVPKTITVNRGDVVRIIYTSVGDTHTFTLPEFNVDTGDVADGEQETVEFVASAAGEFEFYCTPHRDMGMIGTLIVE